MDIVTLTKERDDAVSQKAPAEANTARVEKEKAQLQAKLKEEHQTNEVEEKKGKEELVATQQKMKDAVGLACQAISRWMETEQETVEEKFARIIQYVRQFQARIVGLEARYMPGTLQEVRDQRAEAIRNSIANLKALAVECKKLSTTSAQHYAKLS